jgi:NhaP-type Na+/H+ or K+/H+ antiporter
MVRNVALGALIGAPVFTAWSGGSFQAAMGALTGVLAGAFAGVLAYFFVDL